MIYLDHAATTVPYPSVVEIFCREMQEHYYNPAALYRPAIDRETAVRDALSVIGRTLGCEGKELIVTSGATESTNAAIKGYCHAHRRSCQKIVISAGEHAATRQSVAFLKDLGFQVEIVPLTDEGVIDYDVLAETLSTDTLLISMIGVNNETGALNDIKRIVSLRDKLAPQAALHVDYVQAWNRLSLQLAASGVDLASFSGHKIHGPKGIGLLYCREGIRLTPFIHGGGQQNNRRSGTEHPAAVLALAEAAQIGYGQMEQANRHATELRSFLLAELDRLAVDYRVNGAAVAIPHILSVSFPHIKGETLLHILEQDQIYVATGSACSSSKSRISPVLQAMHLPFEYAEGTLRLSFSEQNTRQEMTQVAASIAAGTAQLTALKPRRRR
ncbi:MAG TPA: cysteine desulfurase [Clostridiaceae bacterium]|nr:cysteine desulfurase [Clostridiaceae bacterium]